MQFTELLGQEVGVLIPKISATIVQRVKVIGVEAGGIWVESQDATNFILRKLGVSSSPNTLVFFLPYHEITFAVVGAKGMISLDEKAFGV